MALVKLLPHGLIMDIWLSQQNYDSASPANPAGLPTCKLSLNRKLSCLFARGWSILEHGVNLFPIEVFFPWSMFLFALSAVLSAGCSALYGWYESWSVLWKLPLCCVYGCFVAMVLLFLLVLVVSCLFVDPKSR